MALAWVLRDPRVTSALIGARTVAQLEDSLAALNNLGFSPEELARRSIAMPRRRRSTSGRCHRAWRAGDLPTK
jgi:aryl-alcohol dehydrogenase-like predicted oxidoreductase